jgi:hypothetical protein
VSTDPGPDTRPAELPIVVGVSASSGSPAAVRWACDQAVRQGAAVVAVRAWRPARPPSSTSGPPALYAADLAAELDRERTRLHEDVERAVGAAVTGHPDPPLAYELEQGTALSVLQTWSRQASLLVLDAPRRTDAQSTPLLAHRLVYTAGCPVVIMPPAVADQPDSAFVAAAKRLAADAGRAAGSAGRPGMRPPRVT